MRLDARGSLRLAATDLAKHLSCRHLTQLDLAVARGELERPLWHDPRAEALRERGFEHERAYVEQLRDAGREVLELDDPEGELPEDQRLAATRAAMARGVEVIVQGALTDGRWFGLPDVLLRTEAETELGPWGYEAVDTKLARETRGTTVLQLALYSDLIEGVQGAPPAEMHVVAPGDGGSVADPRAPLAGPADSGRSAGEGPEEPLQLPLAAPAAAALSIESLRVADYAAYFRLVKRRLETAVGLSEQSARGGAERTYPEPVEFCELCAWWPECRRRWVEDDHLSLVAGAGRSQRRELEERGIATLERLAGEPLPISWRPRRGAVESYEKLREQARVQLEGRQRRAPYWELLDRGPELGLARLPEPDPADVFFDFEGDPFVGTAGLEYLFGWVTLDAAGEPGYDELWAHDGVEEKAAFERFVDAMVDRQAASPRFHIFHYGHYEPSTLKRLMGRYATREAEVDQLLRTETFVDLHQVVRQALRASVEGYSLKDLEWVTGFERREELRRASRARARLERLLELHRPAEITAELREEVRLYNEEDCLSTLRLRDWLERRRSELEAEGEEVPRPAAGDRKRTDTAQDKEAELRELAAALTEGVSEDPEERAGSPEASARWLMAHLLDYHWREQKAAWWEFYRLRDLSPDELLEEASGLVGLELVGEVPGGTAACPRHRYRYPEQRLKVKVDAQVYVGASEIGTLVGFDRAARTIDVAKRKDSAALHPPAVFFHRIVRPAPKPKALFAIGEEVAAGGPLESAPPSPVTDLLLRRPPSLAVRTGADGGSDTGSDTDAGDVGAVSVAPDETTLEAARRLAVTLDRGVLPIQGPPGSGKTYTGARMAVELVKRGRRVGVSAVSHAVIRNFLEEAIEAGREEGVELRCVRRPSGRRGPESLLREGPLVEERDYARLQQLLEDGEVDVVAGTSWLWAREEFRGSVDTLFVDEAGQMALADVLVCTRGASSLVLLGDPQQLEQPQQGSHPEGTHVSALEHLLGGRATLPPGAGLFLEHTYRLHPDLCTFTSEVFYDGRLRPVDGLERQRLDGPVLAGAGLRTLAVEHEGNQSSSAEESAAIAALVERLIDGTTSWTDERGATRALRLEDVLVVAPYNDQVHELLAALPAGARVGTVDKFQGQEAPVVIFSTATSTPELAPRGMEFLYDSSRLNVATSRARGACVLVGNPRLYEPECHTPRQMRLANAFCRYIEAAAELPPAAPVDRAASGSAATPGDGA